MDAAPTLTCVAVAIGCRLTYGMTLWYFPLEDLYTSRPGQKLVGFDKC